MEQKTTESTPMPNVEDQGTKTIEFSPIGNGDGITNNRPETKREDSQMKRTSFREKLAAMVGTKPREKEEVTTTTEKGTPLVQFPRYADQGKEQTMEGAVGHQNGQAAESKLSLVELEDLMSKLDLIDKKLKCSEEDRQESEKELRHKKKKIWTTAST